MLFYRRSFLEMLINFCLFVFFVTTQCQHEPAEMEENKRIVRYKRDDRHEIGHNADVYNKRFEVAEADIDDNNEVQKRLRVDENAKAERSYNKLSSEDEDSLVRRDQLSELKNQLAEAKKKLKTKLRECGEKYKFVPLAACRDCWFFCNVLKQTDRCPSCKSLCLQDEKDLQSKGCITDKTEIKGLNDLIKDVRSRRQLDKSQF